MRACRIAGLQAVCVCVSSSLNVGGSVEEFLKKQTSNYC